MRDFDVGCLPVCDGWYLRGIVTDRDIALRAVAAGLQPGATPVEQIMSRGVRCCWPEDKAAAAVAEMARSQLRRLPILDRAGRLLGIVSLTDLAAALPVQEALRRVSQPRLQLPRVGVPSHAVWAPRLPDSAAGVAGSRRSR